MSENKSPVISVLPRVLLCGSLTEVTLTAGNVSDGEYGLRIYPVSYPSRDNTTIPLTLKNGKATVTIHPPKEQEYRLVVYSGSDWVADCMVYAVESDLYRLNPYKGDFHMHSTRSDGSEPPAEVAAQCRRIGLDIMAVTDHGQYQPSLEAIEAFKGLKLDMRMYPGEEVHPPENPVHIINFGGNSSVNALFDTPEYRQEVAAMQSALPPLAEGCDPYEYASSLWVFRKIREFGGMSIFCHPYWRCLYYDAPQEFYISEGLTTQMFRDRPFDAYEVLGGYSLADQDSNSFQTARYYEERLNGPLPIVGVSDAHGCYHDLFSWYYTLVFAAGCTAEEVRDGICSCLSVAVEKLPGREHRAFGPARLVNYAIFLLREYFPYHDALCAEEGQLMMDWLGGDASAAAKLEGLSGRTAAWQKECFGR